LPPKAKEADMPTVAEVLRRKGPKVVTTTPQASVLDAARLMNTHRIGSLVVLAGGGESGGGVVGILTERDVLTRIVAAGRDPKATKVADVMTTPVIFCTPQTDLDDLRATMVARKIRHVPATDQGALCGMVSIGDLNALHAETLSVTVQVLEGYIARG
jgi:CBS domain-containing protein